jgi:hypothetical protein
MILGVLLTELHLRQVKNRQMNISSVFSLALEATLKEQHELALGQLTN